MRPVRNEKIIDCIFVSVQKEEYDKLKKIEEIGNKLIKADWVYTSANSTSGAYNRHIAPLILELRKIGNFSD